MTWLTKPRRSHEKKRVPPLSDAGAARGTLPSPKTLLTGTKHHTAGEQIDVTTLGSRIGPEPICLAFCSAALHIALAAVIANTLPSQDVAKLPANFIGHQLAMTAHLSRSARMCLVAAALMT